jgi:hypothetical protein
MSSITPSIVHPELNMIKGREEKSMNNNSSSGLSHSPSNDRDINRSEGEGLGTTSYHKTINNQTESNNKELKYHESINTGERKIGDKIMAVGDKITHKINDFDHKMGFSESYKQFDNEYHVTERLDTTGKKVNDIAVHFGRALSKGHIKHAFVHSFDAGRIGECERKKHDPKGLGPPAWIPESDKEGLVEGSVGKEESWNSLFEKEAQEWDRKNASNNNNNNTVTR